MCPLGYAPVMRWILAWLAVCVVLLAAGCGSESAEQGGGSQDAADIPDYASLGLATDGTVSSIDQELILSGGPPKDGIPALTEPEFVSVEESDLAPASQGILVELGEERRFYPYSIIVWHEIVNDRIGDRPIAVTF